MNRFRFIIILALLGWVFFFSFFNCSELKKEKERLLSFLAPLIRSSATVQKKIGGLGQQLMTLEQLDREYKRLFVENKRLQGENDTLRGLEEENNKLRQVVGYRARLLLPGGRSGDLPLHLDADV